MRDWARQGEGEALGNLGSAYYSLGKFHRAINYYEQSLQIARKIRDCRSEGIARWNLALAWEQLGDRAQAIVCVQAALVIRDQIEDPNAAKVRQQLAEWKAPTSPNGEDVP